MILFVLFFLFFVVSDEVQGFFVVFQCLLLFPGFLHIFITFC